MPAWALVHLPVTLQQILEILVVPLGGVCGPRALKSAGEGVETLAFARAGAAGARPGVYGVLGGVWARGLAPDRRGRHLYERYDSMEGVWGKDDLENRGWEGVQGGNGRTGEEGTGGAGLKSRVDRHCTRCKEAQS